MKNYQRENIFEGKTLHRQTGGWCNQYFVFRHYVQCAYVMTGIS